MRNAAAEKPVTEPAPVREEIPKPAAPPPAEAPAPNSLLDHVIVATMPEGEVEKVLLYERRPGDTDLAEEPRVVFMTLDEEEYEPLVEEAPEPQPEPQPDPQPEPAQAPPVPLPPPDAKSQPPLEPIRTECAAGPAAGKVEFPPLPPAKARAEGPRFGTAPPLPPEAILPKSSGAIMRREVEPVPAEAVLPAVPVRAVAGSPRAAEPHPAAETRLPEPRVAVPPPLPAIPPSPLRGTDRIVVIPSAAAPAPGFEPRAVGGIRLPEPGFAASPHAIVVKSASPAGTADRIVVIPHPAGSALSVKPLSAGEVKPPEPELAAPPAPVAVSEAAPVGGVDRIVLIPPPVRRESAIELRMAAASRLPGPALAAPGLAAIRPVSSPTREGLDAAGRIIVVPRPTPSTPENEIPVAAEVRWLEPEFVADFARIPAAPAEPVGGADRIVVIPSPPRIREELSAAGPSVAIEPEPAEANAPRALAAAVGDAGGTLTIPSLPLSTRGAASSDPGPAGFFTPLIGSAEPEDAPVADVAPLSPGGACTPSVSFPSGLKTWREPVREAGPTLVKTGSQIPRGFCEALEAERLACSDEPISGVVAAIGVNDFERVAQGLSKGALKELGEIVEKLLRVLLAPDDFAYVRSPEEGVLVMPNLSGAAAQKRLHHLAERIWDFQLRSLSALPVLFSWGAVTVTGESLSEAVAQAIEQMNQTRDNRRGFDVSGVRSRRAVNF